MIFYICLFLFCVFVPLLSTKKHAFTLSMIALWSVFAFRDIIAVDDYGYMLAFQRITSGWNYDIETSFIVISHLVSNLGMNYKAVFFIYATISFFLLYKSLNMIFENNYQKSLYIASFLGLSFISSISVMRQFLAACICFYAFAYYIKKEKLLMPIIMCLFGIFIHTGSLLSIPFLFVCNSDFYKRKKAKLFIIVLCTIFGYSNITIWIINMISSWLPKSYQIYLSTLNTHFSGSGGTVTIALLILFVIQCLYPIKDDNDIINKIEIGQLFYLGLLFLLVNSGVASRLAFTFIPFVATLPYTFSKRIKYNQSKLFTVMIGLVMLSIFTLSIVSTSRIRENLIIPYKASLNFWK